MKYQFSVDMSSSWLVVNNSRERVALLFWIDHSARQVCLNFLPVKVSFHWGLWDYHVNGRGLTRSALIVVSCHCCNVALFKLYSIFNIICLSLLVWPLNSVVDPCTLIRVRVKPLRWPEC